MFASLKLKDAIVDRFRKVGMKRPNVDARNPQVSIHLHVANDACTISLDSSGASLHKRGYRTERHEAPISEVLAAGMLKLSRWSGEEPFLDPMCGSGTIAIEAAMMAKNIQPGELGREYSFMHWKNFSTEMFARVKERNFHNQVNFQIYASDISRQYINMAWKHAENAQVADVIKFEVKDFRNLAKQDDCNLLIFNPPYGERLEAGDREFYSAIGERLKHEFTGSDVWLISTAGCLKNLGLRPSVK